MRYSLLIHLLLLCVSASARNWYFSSSTGNDNTGSGTLAAPYATITKLNTLWSSIVAGDSILFKRGDVFTGTITLGKSGTSTARITLGAYGTGALPVISGFTTVTSWSSLGGSIYESGAIGTSITNLNMVTVNGKNYEMGRYPNYGVNSTSLEIEKGWATMDAVSEELTWIQDNELAASPDWDHARLVVRCRRWQIDTAHINSHTHDGTKSTINIPAPVFDANRARQEEAIEALVANYGYFIENHPATLDKHGEWYWNQGTKKLRIWLSSAPSNLVIKVATTNILIDFYEDSYITIENIRFEGANQHAIRFNKSTFNIIKNCEFQWHGDRGIEANDGGNNNLTFSYCTFLDCNSFGIDFRSAGANQRVDNCFFKRIGLHNGMATTGSHSMNGIIFNGGTGHIIEYNRIDSTGYAGIRWNTSNNANGNTELRYNEITNFCMMKDDGGGIYTGGAGTKTGRRVHHNIVYNGIGAPEGTKASTGYAVGIYNDDGSTGIETYNNISFNNPSYGYYAHNNNNTNAHDNLFYNNATQAGLINENGDKDNNGNLLWDTMSLMSFKNNICFARTSSQWTAKFWTWKEKEALIRIDEAVGAPRTAGSNRNIDYNKYMRPIVGTQNHIQVRELAQVSDYGYTYPTLSQWRAGYTHDINSSEAPKTFASGTNADTAIRFIYNPKRYDSTITFSRTYMSTDSVIYFSGQSVTLKPFTAMVLMAHTAEQPNPPPTKPTEPVIVGQSYKTYRLGNMIVKMGDQQNDKIAGQFIYHVAQNLWAWSEELNNAVWTPSNVTVTANRSWGPDGTISMDAITESTTSSNKHIRQAINPILDTLYTISAFVKDSTAGMVQLYYSISGGSFVGTDYANFNLTNGTKASTGSTILDAGIELSATDPHGKKVYRIWATTKAKATSTGNISGLSMINSLTATRLATYTGTGKIVLVTGMQMNTGYRKPYTKTTTQAIP